MRDILVLTGLWLSPAPIVQTSEQGNMQKILLRFNALGAAIIGRAISV